MLLLHHNLTSALLDKLEDEGHFLINCPLYAENRAILFQACRENSKNFESLITDKEKFIFIKMNESKSIADRLASFVFNAFKIREKAIQLNVEIDG